MTLKQLKPYIYTRLNSLSGITVFDGKAPETAIFPYLVFKFPASNFNFRTRTDRILEIDFWDNTNDDSDILTASTQVKDGKFDEHGILTVPGLNYSYQKETSGFYRAYIDFEGEIPDTSPEISRIQQRYILNIG